MSNSSQDLPVVIGGPSDRPTPSGPLDRPSLVPADVWESYQGELAEAEREESERIALETTEADLQEFVSAEHEIGLSDGVPAQPARASAALAKVEVFNALAPEALTYLVTGAREGYIHTGSYLFVEGDAAESFFVVLEGTVEVVRHRDDKEIPLRQLARTEPVGLFGLFSGQVRAACARAVDDARVIEIPCPPLQHLIHVDPALHDRLARFYRERLIEGFVGASRLFADLEGAGRARLISRFGERVLQAGEALLHPGEVCNLVAVVLNGRLVMELKPKAGQDPRQYEVYPGQFVCVTSAFTGVPSRMRVFAPEPTVVALLGHRELAEIMKDFPALRALPARLPGVSNTVDRDVYCGHTGVPGL